MEKYLMRTNFLWLFIYILFLHAVAIFFFTRGFLLTRTELSAFSECADIAEAPCSRSDSSYAESHVSFEQNSVRDEEEGQNKQACWTKPAVDRVVLIVLDAIRFDFVAPSSFFKEVKPWMNKLQVLQKLASEEGSSARIFKAIADPPTTSLQRLKGLTTGGLPTFIDVGNSFGAPAITEDNLIYQLIRNGRRVVMMGDDTWLQLFPNHFQEAYPFPSFNVKDLHTVDDGVIEHLFPALYRNDWNILVAHFLGVDHAGHIFGVDSTPMIEKLEQYNGVLEEVVSILKNHSEPGGLHENTLLIVMGDHGQTLNGDHGGGTPEEVETSIFAMSMRNPAGLTPATLDTSVCKSALDGKNNICIGSIPQLDFAVTLAALVGIPFPFGSVGRVNPELYSLSAGTWYRPSSILDDKPIDCLKLQRWMEQYADVLCINCWQVKRYIDAYSASSIIGFSPQDLLQLADIYASTQANFSQVIGQQSFSDDRRCEKKISALQSQIDAYSNYLEAVADLSRSKWTKFGGKMMILGLTLLLASLAVHLTAILRVGKIIVLFSKDQYKISKACFPWGHLLAIGFCSIIFGMLCFPFVFSILEGVTFPQAVGALKDHVLLLVLGTFTVGSSIGYLMPFTADAYKGWRQYCTMSKMKLGCFVNYEGNLFRCMIAASIVMIRAFSFLSNSYILAEGKVANFLLASTGVLTLKSAIENQSMILEALLFLILNSVLGIVSENAFSKETMTPTASAMYLSAMIQSAHGRFIMTILAAVLPLLILILLMNRWIRVNHFSWDTKCWYAFYAGAILSYLLILLHWTLEDISSLQALAVSNVLKDTARVLFPRLVYFLTAGLASLLFYERKSKWKGGISNFKENLAVAAVTMLSTWSSTILLLLGKQGPFIAFLAMLQGWCLLKLQKLGKGKEGIDARTNEIESDPLLVIQWSLLAVQLFFCTGHRCTFDGLRYGAAFVGFDNFNIIRQGVLLAIDTFGVSHILPIFGLPLLVTTQYSHFRNYKHQQLRFLQLMQVFLIYGLASAFTATLTTICVTIQRRHLMDVGSKGGCKSQMVIACGIAPFPSKSMQCMTFSHNFRKEGYVMIITYETPI